VHYSGDDHLDADRVVLKAKRAKKKAKREPGSKKKGQASAGSPEVAPRSRGQLEGARDKLTVRLERAEARIAEIDELFCQPGYFEKTPSDEVSKFETERTRLGGEVDRLTREWHKLEADLEVLAPG